MYHEIPEGPEDAGYFAVARDTFGSQLDRLASIGLTACSLESVFDDPSSDRVALTFDDGHITHFREAFPLLEERGLNATFFVTTGWVGKPGYVTWDQLREMNRAGMSIQSHTVNHPFLSELSMAEARNELVESKAAIENELGVDCTTLGLPNGDPPRRFRKQDFAEIGYSGVANSRWGPNAFPGQVSAGTVRVVRRYTVRKATTKEGFLRLVRADDPAFGLEGSRQVILNTIRSTMGPTRYARWRKKVLRVMGR